MTQPLYQSVGGTRSFNIYSGGLTTHGSGGKEPLSNPGTGDSVWFSGAGRVNTVMQACFFAISGVLPRDEAIAAIKHAIEKTYGRRGAAVVRRNWEAVPRRKKSRPLR